MTFRRRLSSTVLSLCVCAVAVSHASAQGNTGAPPHDIRVTLLGTASGPPVYPGRAGISTLVQAGEYPETVRLVDAVVQAARALPDARRDRLELVGHSRGGGAIQQYLLAGKQVNAAVLHSSGYALRPAGRIDAFRVPLLIMHGTADGPADDGGPNNRVELAREFDAALRKSDQPVETAYTEGGGHNTFFTSPAQRDAELKWMIEFLRRHLTSAPPQRDRR
jgi:alpha-beta hydrolase superfamily lysophospholipase